ncbi:hypothetical protein FQN57_006815 [Myotisia sp. PD_48]|nr:hypothetical protein FQN57_006815 [Myotisia sp. PD_48]
MREGSHSTHSVIDKLEHGRKRRLISQGLGDSALRASESTITTTIDKFLHVLAGADYAGGEAYKGDANVKEWGPSKNMAETCNFLTFDVFSDLLLGKTFGMLNSSLNRYIIRGVESSSRRAGIFLQMPSLTKIYADMLLFRDTHVWRGRFFQTVVDISTERLAIKDGRNDIFQLIQDAKDPETGQALPLDELVSECTLLIVAGSDTSSTALAATFFYLAKYPAAYQKLATEVRAAFGSKDSIKGGQTLNSCVYLRACIDEAMRLSPSVGGALWREAQTGGAIVDGVPIPAGYDVGTGQYAVHHNEAYYPRAFEYQPERWIAQDGVTQEMVDRAKSAFCPFSLGPRGCPGKSLAYLEISITIARAIWLYDFTFTNPADAKLREFELYDHFTSGGHGPHLRFKQREIV